MTGTVYFQKFDIGWLKFESLDDAIIGIDYVDEAGESTISDDVIEQCIRELDEYFNGDRKSFDVKINPAVQGTPFQQSVWEQLRQIPYGETISYKTLAERISGSNYSRAVANANGKNPISIIIPCHRVIASNNTLGGYTGGLDKKKLLLSVEGR
ncbi:MAG: methylated-DNA--[protein]-cysteine S-methyltransferase [Jeotgalicoccus sp.]